MTLLRSLLFNLLFYPIATTLLAVCLTFVRDRSGSVIAAGLFHGSWNSVSHMHAGIYAVFAVLSAAILFCALRRRRASAPDSTLSYTRRPA